MIVERMVLIVLDSVEVDEARQVKSVQYGPESMTGLGRNMHMACIEQGTGDIKALEYSR